MKHLFIISILICVLLAILGTGCAFLQEKGGTQPQGGSAPGGGITVKLLFPDNAPLLNQKAELRCTVSSKYDLPNTTAQIILPKGATLVDGNLEWQGDLKTDTPISFSVQIIFKEIGKWSIAGGAKNIVTPPGLWFGGDVIYLTVWADHSEFGWPPTGPVQVEQVAPGDVEPVPSSSTEEPDIENIPPPPAVPP